MSNVTVAVKVEDPDPDDAIAKVEILLDGKVTETGESGKPQCELEADWSLPSGKHYCFVKVTQADGNQLWSAPIWVRVAE